MQTNAACVTGYRLAYGMPRTNGRVSTERSAVVTRLQSGLPGLRLARIIIGTDEA